VCWFVCELVVFFTLQLILKDVRHCKTTVQKMHHRTPQSKKGIHGNIRFFNSNKARLSRLWQRLTETFVLFIDSLFINVLFAIFIELFGKGTRVLVAPEWPPQLINERRTITP
jgi:hypothetical protein